jgi:hypothetical protein
MRNMAIKKGEKRENNKTSKPAKGVCKFELTYKIVKSPEKFFAKL